MSNTMPAVFIGHGSPMNTLESNRYTQCWRELGRRVPRPRAVLAISAHWFMAATAVTGMERPRTIHDFFGFPTRLATFQYPAPGAPDAAREVIDTIKPLWAGLDEDSWGLDHGTWSVLAHVFPGADVPVVQLSLNATKPFEYHLELGARLAPLREKGILVLASGNVVHNLRRIEFDQPDAVFPWAERFDDAVQSVLTSRPASILEVLGHPDFDLAVPTPDHFIPVLYLAGLAGAAGKALAPFAKGYAMGSLSMTCYGLDAPELHARGPGAADVPDPAVVPPDETNI